MGYNSSQKAITMEVDKSCIKYGEDYTNNIIFVNLKLYVKSSDFEDSSIPITSLQAEQIFSDSIENGYLGIDNYASDKFKPGENLFNYEGSLYNGVTGE